MSAEARWWRRPGERIVHSFDADGTGWKTSRCGEVLWSAEMLWIRRPLERPVGMLLDAAASVRCPACAARS